MNNEQKKSLKANNNFVLVDIYACGYSPNKNCVLQPGEIYESVAAMKMKTAQTLK